MNDASDATALITLAVVSLAGAAIGALFGLLRYSRLELHDPVSGAEIIPLREPCDCGASWCDGRNNGAGRRWWTP